MRSSIQRSIRPTFPNRRNAHTKQALTQPWIIRPGRSLLVLNTKNGTNAALARRPGSALPAQQGGTDGEAGSGGGDEDQVALVEFALLDGRAHGERDGSA